MLASLYPATMVWMVVMTILWFWFDERKRRTGAARVAAFFGAGLLLYFPALLACEGGLVYKLCWIVPRDALTILVAIIVSGYIQRNRTFLLTLLGFLAFTSAFYWHMLERGVRFGQGLDPNAELLVDAAAPATDPANLAALQKAFPELRFEPLLRSLARPDQTELDNYFTADLPRSKLHQLNRLLKRLEASPLVNHVEFNERVYTQQVRQPNKPPAAGFNDPEASKQWALGALNLKGYSSWVGKQSPRKQVLLAVIDTGATSPATAPTAPASPPPCPTTAKASPRWPAAKAGCG